MNNNLPVSVLVEEVRSLWATGRKVMIEVAYRLKQLRDSDAWAGSKSFPQWAEAELEIGQSQTSKLLAIADFYLDKYSPEEIGQVDYERLYLSAKLEGTVEENLAKAKTLSRGELRQEREEKAPCVHDIKPTCVKCWAVQTTHDV